MSHLDASKKTFLRCAHINYRIIACLRAEKALDMFQVSQLSGEKSLIKRSEMIFEWMEKSQSLYDIFLRVMDENEQQHVSNLLKGIKNGPHIPLSETRYSRLEKITPELMDVISNDAELVANLRAKHAISEIDRQDITQEKKEYKRNWNLIEAILRRSEYAFDCFDQALRETLQVHAAHYLHEGHVVAVHANTTHPDKEEVIADLFNKTILSESKDDTSSEEKILTPINGYNIHPVAAKPGQSIVFFLYCKTVDDTITFTKLFNSGELQSIVEVILNRLLSTACPENMEQMKARLSLDNKEILSVEKFSGIEDWMSVDLEKAIFESKIFKSTATQTEELQIEGKDLCPPVIIASSRELHWRLGRRRLYEDERHWRIGTRALSEDERHWRIGTRALSEDERHWRIGTRALSEDERHWRIGTRALSEDERHWRIGTRALSEDELHWRIRRALHEAEHYWRIGRRALHQDERYWENEGREFYEDECYLRYEGRDFCENKLYSSFDEALLWRQEARRASLQTLKSLITEEETLLNRLLPAKAQSKQDELSGKQKSDPILVTDIKREAKYGKEISGLAILDRKLFVLSKWSSEVEVYDSMIFGLCRRLDVAGVVDPQDIVSCNNHKCLYILENNELNDQSNKIWRINPNGAIIKKWSTTVDFGDSLSVTDESNVILVIHNKNKLNEYSPDGHLIREINLSSDAGILNPWHAVKLTSGNFLVSHGFGFFELHRVSIVDGDGKLKKSFGGKRGLAVGQMNIPFHFAVDADGFVLVVDRFNSRILLLDPDLQFKREIISKEKHGIRDPQRILVDKSNGRLFVADNKWNNGQILVFQFQLTVPKIT